MIELLIVLIVIGIIAALSTTTFIHKLKYDKLEKDTQNIVALLERAHSLTLSARGDDWYGVMFTTGGATSPSGTSTTATLYQGSLGYDPSNPKNETYNVYGGVTITRALALGAKMVNFDRLTGATSQSGTISMTIAHPSAFKGVLFTNTITIYGTGVVETSN